MEKKKSILTGSLIASAIVACSTFSASATEAFHHSTLGSSAEVRTSLSNETQEPAGSTTPTKRKDGKCGGKMKKDGKCGKKMKDGKCGEGKCGKGKKKADKQ